MAEPGICGNKGCTIGEQPRDTLLLGHFTSYDPDDDKMKDYVKRLGQGIDVELKFIDYESGMLFTVQGAKTAAANNAVIFIKIEPWKGKKFKSDTFEYCKEINKGTFDAFWCHIGKQIRAFNRPVVITFAHEANMEYRNKVYPWAVGAVEGERAKYEANLRKKAKTINTAYMRVHDLITQDKYTDPNTGKEKKGGGAKNTTWVLNFDARYYARMRPDLKRKYARQYGGFDKYIASRLKLLIPHDPKNPGKKYFKKVVFDFYINEAPSSQKDFTPKQIIKFYLDPFLAAIDQIPLLRDKEKWIGECGVSLPIIRGMSRARKKWLRERKAGLLTAIFDYVLAYNKNPKTTKRIELVALFDVNKIWDLTNQGFWGISSETDEAEKAAGDALHDWFAAHTNLFEKPVLFYQNDNPGVLVEFQGPPPPKPITLAASPEQKIPEKFEEIDEPVKPPEGSLIAKDKGDNRRKGLALLDRWKLEKYIDREEENGQKLLKLGIDALLEINPDLPMIFGLDTIEDYEEIGRLQEADQSLHRETALSSFFDDPEGYWENAVTFVSVYAQKAVEDQDKEKITNAVDVCELLLQRYRKQKKMEKDRVKNYAYPSAPNLALLKLTLADVRSQLKKLDENTYQKSILLCLEAIDLFQKLERDGLLPPGADYFSIVKSLVTIGDLKVRIAQIRVRTAQKYSQEGNRGKAKEYFKKANSLFREAQRYYQAVANLDMTNFDAEKGVGGIGIRLNAEPLPGMPLRLNIGVDRMLTAWKNNQSKGYILKNDRKRGFQGTFHFLKAIGAVKIQGAFLENPIKEPEDYKMTDLFKRLSLLQNSLAELKHDKYLKIDFLLGLANLIKLNLLTMISDRAQYDTIRMDRASAMKYFNTLFADLKAIIPELPEAIKNLRLDLVEEEVTIIIKKNIIEGKRGRRDALDFLADLHSKVKSTHPRLAASILKTRRKVAAGWLRKDIFLPDRKPNIDDNLLVDPLVAPFKHTAACAKRFALIMVQLATLLAQKAYDHSKPPSEKAEPRFPYLYTLSNLTLAEMGVRTFFITDRPFKPTKLLDRIDKADESIEKIEKKEEMEETWSRFQSLYLKGNLLMLRSITADYRKAVVVLDKALKELEKFIHPSQVFYKAQIYLLQAQAYTHLGKQSGLARQKAGKVIGELTDLIEDIEEIAPKIGWNLKDFYVRYSRVVINFISRGGAIGKYERKTH